MIKGIIFDFNRTLHDKDANQLFPDTIPLLSKLSKSYKLCLVTRGHTEEEIRSFGLHWFFIKIVATGDKTDAHFR